MSRYAGQFGRGRPYNKNPYYGAQNDNFQSQNVYANTYEQDYVTTGDNSYEYSAEETAAYMAAYGDESENSQYDYQTNTEDYSTDYNADNNAEYTTGYSAEYGRENTNTAEYTEEYDATGYDYGYEQSAEGYGYEQDTYGGHSEPPVTDYHNYTSGGTSRGATRGGYNRGATSASNIRGAMSVGFGRGAAGAGSNRGATNASSHRGATSTGSYRGATNAGFNRGALDAGSHGGTTSTGSYRGATNAGFNRGALNAGSHGGTTSTGSYRGATNAGFNRGALNAGSHGGTTSTGSYRGATNAGFNRGALDAGSHGGTTSTGSYRGATNAGFSRGATNTSFNRGASSAGSNRGATPNTGQFGKRPNYQAQNQFGSAGRGRGRGQINHNAGRKPPQQHWQSQGQFGIISESENAKFGNIENNEGRGQFNLPPKSTGITNIVKPSPVIMTQSPVKKTNGEEKKGQFGLPKESVEPKISTEPSKPESDKKEEAKEEQKAKEESKEQSVFKEESKEESKEEEKDEAKEKLDDEKDDDDNEDSDSSDEDTDFCKYCKLNFKTPKAYHTHTRGLQHTTLVMEAKAKKGDSRFQKEEVDASVLEVHIPEPKEPSPERDDVEDEMETNWMNLDDDVMKFIKENKKPENRDLNPNEVGKNPLPDDFTCPLCNIKCTGAAAFKMHIDGKQHKSNIEAAKQGAKIKKKKLASTGVMVETKERPSKFSEMSKDNPVPMLGLEYVTEFQKSDFKAAPRYVCNLCESKCDGSTIIPHVIGLKHRLKFMQIKKPLMYDHLTKFNSKKKKSEMNANLEDFATEIEAEIGRGDVKIKVELENFDDEDELKETMIRHSKALAVKVKELEEGKTDSFHDESTSRAKSKEPPIKKPRMATELATEWRSRPRYEDHYPDRRDPYERRGPDGPGDRLRLPYDEARRPPYDDARRPPYDDARRPMYDEARRPLYDDRRDPYYGRRYPEDFKASYRDRFDPYRGDDPLYERRMFDERRRLDGLMGERHRLDDPYAERRRVDDIMDRRRYLDELETSRVNDILQRRKRLQEEDVDFLRLQRFMGRENTAASSSPSLSSEEKTRLDSQIARREALLASTARSSTETDDRLARREALLASTARSSTETDDRLARREALLASTAQSSTEADDRLARREALLASTARSSTEADDRLARREALLARTKQYNQELDERIARREALSASTAQSTQETDVQTIQEKLAAHKSSDPNMAARQEKAAKALQEEAAKNPNVNIGEIMSNLSSSMIATEDDAAMALQISNALTQALLKYRIQNAPRELSSLARSIEPMLEQKPVEPSIPGLGASSTTSSSVPSFLRTSQHSSQSLMHPTASGNSSYLQTSVQGTLGSNMQQSSGDNLYQYPQQQSARSSQNQQYSFSGSTQAASTLYAAYSQQQTTASPTWAPVSTAFGGGTSGTATHTATAGVPGTLPSGVAAPPHVLTAGQSQKKPVVDTSNVDQPQKLLLESIRKQTELLKQKIQASVGINSLSNVSSVNVQSEPRHVPSSTQASISANPYTSYASSTTNQVTSAAGHVTSSANKTAVSQYSSQYYQYNYHTAPPNAAPQPVASVQPPLPSAPAPLPPLPTNDLPPLRLKKRK